MFDPAGFRRLASKLLKRSKADAAECRNAISRTYYLVFRDTVIASMKAWARMSSKPRPRV